MFRVPPRQSINTNRAAIAGLLGLSVAALVVTIWIMVEFLREQDIVKELILELPPESAAAAEALAGELRWQFRLTILVVLNLVATGFAVLLLSRAYRASQESLRDFKALAGDILSSIDQTVITTDLPGIVTSINRHGLDLLGVTEALIGSPLSAVTNQLPLEDFRQESRSSGLPVLIRDFPLSEQGTTRILRVFCQSLRNHDNADTGNVMQIRDVTERVLMDDRLRRMERYMGLGSLAAGLHHEIKNPLAALSLHVQLLEEELDSPQTAEDVRQMLGVIKTEVTRIGGVLESFRDFASLGRLSLDTVDLARLIHGQVSLIGPQATRQHIEVLVQLPEVPLPPLTADRMRLEQVLLNLMVNAMEAMPKGGTLTVRVSTTRAAGQDFVRIAIADTGTGVPESVRDRIFDAYFTTKNEGTGMGLALCDKIVRQHNGSLEFHPAPVGSEFEITLPMESP